MDEKEIMKFQNKNRINQINYELIEKKRNNCIIGVRNCRGAGVDSDSEFLVRIKLKQITLNRSKETKQGHYKV